MSLAPLAPGSFTIGCNYWASHAGTRMWRDWREEVVETDFALLARHGLRLVRVFPLWPDFQPVVAMRGALGRLVEYRLGADELPLPAGPHGSLDPAMLARLQRLCELADVHGLHLVVGLVTGWMSGRLFMPAALEGRDPLTDPVALAWQTRLVKGIVASCRGQAAIRAWDLGNECNCMGRAANADEAYHWTATIADAIRSVDPDRPVISGMHSLSPQANGVWRIVDQGELTDFVTTHPYPYWLEHGRLDPLDSYRTTVLPTIETCLYRDVAGKPALAEEIGSMGPMVSCDRVASSWIRANLFSLWAHDARAALWWCAFDQTNLAHAPYDWYGVESELGLFGPGFEPKSALDEMERFAGWLAAAPLGNLPPRRVDAVVVLTRNQDSWAAAIGSFALAKQCGFDLTFRFCDQALPRCSLILLPDLTGPDAIRRHEWLDLLRRVREGATLYVSLHDGVVPGFIEATGLRVIRRSTRTAPTPVFFDQETEAALEAVEGDALECAATTATVLARDPAGGPVLTSHACGRGNILVLTFPLERQVALAPQALDPARSAGARRVYAQLAARLPRPLPLLGLPPAVGATAHDLPDGSCVLVLINHTREPVEAPLRLHPPWALSGVHRGTLSARGETIAVPAHDAVVLQIRPA